MSMVVLLDVCCDILFHTHGTIYFGYNNSERVVINTDYETMVHQLNKHNFSDYETMDFQTMKQWCIN